jgi:predicted nucleic acid-binding protein
VIVVDTSVWVALLQGKPTPLENVLGEGRIAIHPFVLGELLLNGLPKRGPFSQESLENYVQIPVASPTEVAIFIQWAQLAGTGVGYVDAHLLVAARLVHKGVILTLDSALLAQAQRFNIAYADA